MGVETLVAEFIRLNIAGQILKICEDFYHDDLIMTSNGEMFAASKAEALEKHIGFVEMIESFDIMLESQSIEGDKAELVFHYDMKSKDGKEMKFSGRHVMYFRDGKIYREDYETLS